jgi:hypothetical protein
MASAVLTNHWRVKEVEKHACVADEVLEKTAGGEAAAPCSFLWMACAVLE